MQSAGPSLPIRDLAAGVLPGWAVVTPRREAHMRRVAALMHRWAAELGYDEEERTRWRLAGWLHDALRDAPPDQIREWIDDPELRALPGSFLHGPAAAARLAADGYRDDEVLDAIRYHTLGRPDPGELTLALIVADAIEPGRPRQPAWRASLRARMPHAFDAVALEVVREKLMRSLTTDRWLRPELVAMWNRLVARARETA